MNNESVIIAITRKDGGLSLMSLLVVGRGNVLPSGAAWLEDGWWARPSTDAVVESEIAKANEPGSWVSWRRLQPGDLQEDRTYRDAWIDTGAAIVHDMPKAREIHRKHLRARRAAAMADLDGQWMRATGQGKKADADAIEAERQKWRDAPADQRIDAAQTIEELKAVSGP